MNDSTTTPVDSTPSCQKGAHHRYAKRIRKPKKVDGLAAQMKKPQNIDSSDERCNDWALSEHRVLKIENSVIAPRKISYARVRVKPRCETEVPPRLNARRFFQCRDDFVYIPLLIQLEIKAFPVILVFTDSYSKPTVQ